MSTIRSFRTGRPRIGSTVTFGATSLTSTLHASRLCPSISIASEPQTPWAHERRRHQGLGALEKEPELDHLHHLGVEHRASVLHVHVLVAIAEALEDPLHL